MTSNKDDESLAGAMVGAFGSPGFGSADDAPAVDRWPHGKARARDLSDGELIAALNSRDDIDAEIARRYRAALADRAGWEAVALANCATARSHAERWSEAEIRLVRAMAAIRPFAFAAFNDNGDVTIDGSRISRADYIRARAAYVADLPGQVGDAWLDMSMAPRGPVGGRPATGPMIIAAGNGGVVTRSRWLPDQNRWEMFTTGTPPLAWQPWPAHPHGGGTA